MVPLCTALILFATAVFGTDFNCGYDYYLKAVPGCTEPSTTGSILFFVDSANKKIGFTQSPLSESKGMFVAPYDPSTARMGVIFPGPGKITFSYSTYSSTFSQIRTPGSVLSFATYTITSTQAATAVKNNWSFSSYVSLIQLEGENTCFGLVSGIDYGATLPINPDLYSTTMVGICNESPYTTVGIELSCDVCARCANGCMVCSSDTVCSECYSGYYLLDSTCYPCTSPCSTCSPDATTCTACVYGYYLSGSDCLPCTDPCAHCFDGSDTSCHACVSGYYLQPAPNNSICLTTCPDLYWKNSRVCTACHSYCSECNGSTKNKCTACKEAYIYQSVVATTCDTYCYDGSYLLEDGSSCANCSHPCATCTDGASASCLSCKTGFFLQPSPNTSVCLDHCSLGFYPNSSTKSCLACDPACTECFGGTNHNCTVCESGYYLTSNSCLPCGSNCTTCQDGTATGCLTCKDGYFNQPTPDVGVCLDNCSTIGFYPNTFTKNCSECDVACSECTGAGPSSCNTCNVAYYMTNDHVCVKFTSCNSASDCENDIGHPECNGTVCWTCSNDAECQQWYNEPEQKCNVSVGACFFNVDPVTDTVTTISSTISSSAMIAVTSAAVAGVAVASAAASGAATVSAFASGGGSSQSIAALRITKLATLLRYVSIQFPYQAEKLFESFSSSQKSIEKILTVIFGSEQYKQSTTNLPTRFIKFGDSSLFLKNAGTTLLISLAVGIGIGITRLGLYWARGKRNLAWTRKFLKVQKILEWNYLLGWVLGAYPELVLGLSLQLYDLPFINLSPSGLISFIVCGVSAPVVVLFPLLCYFLMRSKKEDRRLHRYHDIRRYEVLTSEFKENSSEAKVYQVLIFLRTQLMIFPLVFWHSNPLAQIIFLLVSSAIVVIYHIFKAGYRSKFNKVVVLVNELLLLLGIVGIFLQVVVSKTEMETQNQQLANIFGWILSSALSSLMIFNFLITILGLLRLVWTLVKSRLTRSKSSPNKKSTRLSRSPRHRAFALPSPSHRSERRDDVSPDESFRNLRRSDPYQIRAKRSRTQKKEKKASLLIP